MVPKKILDSWNRVNKRINEFCKIDNNKSFKLLFITDVHIGWPNAHHIEQLRYLKELLPLNKIDLIVNGGDIGLDVGEDDEEAKRVINKTKEATEYNIPYFFIKGNHDVKPSIIKDHDLNLILNSYFTKNIKEPKGTIILDKDNGGGYGYYVDKNTNTKVIFLNTCENVRGYDMSINQLRFVIDQLEKAKEKNIVLIGHYCINKCGAWTRYPVEDTFGIAALKKIESAFAKKEKGQIGSLKFDFTNSKGEILLHLCGDSHFNNQSASDGYLIACRQGYGGIDSIDIPKGATFDNFDKHELCNFDILVITPSGHSKLFRVGAGEKIRDIEIS